MFAAATQISSLFMKITEMQSEISSLNNKILNQDSKIKKLELEIDSMKKKSLLSERIENFEAIDENISEIFPNDSIKTSKPELNINQNLYNPNDSAEYNQKLSSQSQTIVFVDNEEIKSKKENIAPQKNISGMSQSTPEVKILVGLNSTIGNKKDYSNSFANHDQQSNRLLEEPEWEKMSEEIKANLLRLKDILSDSEYRILKKNEFEFDTKGFENELNIIEDNKISKLAESLKREVSNGRINPDHSSTLVYLKALQSKIDSIGMFNSTSGIKQLKNAILRQMLRCFDKKKLTFNINGELSKDKNEKSNQEFLKLLKKIEAEDDKFNYSDEFKKARLERFGSISVEELKELKKVDIFKLIVNEFNNGIKMTLPENVRFSKLVEFFGYESNCFYKI